MKKNVNYCKLLFFILLGIVIGTVLFITINVFNKREEDVLFNTGEIAENEPSFQLKLNKKQTNELLNHYTDNFQKDSIITYNFVIENLVMLKGTLPILGTNINFYMYFQPILLKNKDLELKTKSISVGTLSLPASEILNYIKKEYKFPEWVKIDTKNEAIYFELNNFETEDGMKFNIESIDLLSDEVIINVYLKNS